MNKLNIKIGNNPGDETNDWVKVELRNRKGESCLTDYLNDNGRYDFNRVGVTVNIDADDQYRKYKSLPSLAGCRTGSFRPDEELQMKLVLERPVGSLWVWDSIAIERVEAHFGDDVWLSNETVTCQSDPCQWFPLKLK